MEELLAEFFLVDFFLVDFFLDVMLVEFFLVDLLFVEELLIDRNSEMIAESMLLLVVKSCPGRVGKFILASVV